MFDTAFRCRNFGKARECARCIHNPINQMTESRLRDATAKIDKLGHCRNYTQKIERVIK